MSRRLVLLVLCAIGAAYITGWTTTGIDPSPGRLVITFAVWWAILLGAASFYRTEARR